MSLVEFTDPRVAASMLEGIRSKAARCGVVKIMEVCGTHTMEIGRLGLRKLLPENVELVSGPGCPVCVTPGAIIDTAAELALAHDAIVCTFGDMVRVPGNRTSLDKARADGGAVEVLTSPLQAVKLAKGNPSRKYVFVAVGFETTIPVVARAVQGASEAGLKNLFFLVSHRLVPPALDALVSDPEIGISAFMLPGHVSAVIGERPYARLVEQGIPAAITGFEPLDILGGIHKAVSLVADGEVAVVNMYPRVVREEGNAKAVELIERVFAPVDAHWRGIGTIPQSGLALREEFDAHNAARHYGVSSDLARMPDGCSCGAVLKGKITPNRCPLFGKQCNPQNPVGPCMVSSEGSCAAYFRYGE